MEEYNQTDFQPDKTGRKTIYLIGLPALVLVIIGIVIWIIIASSAPEPVIVNQPLKTPEASENLIINQAINSNFNINSDESIGQNITEDKVINNNSALDESATPPAVNETVAVAGEVFTATKYRFDTDSDGLSDEDERFYGTDINNPDTDGDGYTDGAEVKSGYNPLGVGRKIKIFTQ